MAFLPLSREQTVRRVALARMRRHDPGFQPEIGPKLVPLEYRSISEIDREYENLMRRLRKWEAAKEKDPNATPPRFRSKKAEPNFEQKAMDQILEAYLKTHDDVNPPSRLVDRVERIQKAAIHALDAHEGQTRSDGRPYAYHVLSVALYSALRGMTATDIEASLNHDTVEDRGVSVAELGALFGPHVANTVALDSKHKIRQVALLDSKAPGVRVVRGLEGQDGVQRDVAFVSPHSPYYHAEESVEDKSLRPLYRDPIVRMHLEKLLSEKVPVPVQERYLSGHSQRVSDEWSALHIKLHDALHNLQTIMGKLKKVAPEGRLAVQAELSRFVRERRFYIDLFHRFAPSMYDSLPKFVQREYESQLSADLLAQENRSRRAKRLHPLLHGSAVYDRLVPTRDMVRDDLQRVRRIHDLRPVVHLVKKGKRYSQTEFEIHFPYYLFMDPTYRFRDVDAQKLAEEQVEKELFQQLRPGSARRRQTSFLQWKPRTFGVVKPGKSLLLKNDPRYFVYRVDLKHLPVDRRQAALDSAIQHVVALQSGDRFDDLPDEVKDTVGKKIQSIRWTRSGVNPSRITAFLPRAEAQVGNGDAGRESALAAVFAHYKKKGVVRRVVSIDRHHPRATLQPVQFELHPAFVKAAKKDGLSDDAVVEKFLADAHDELLTAVAA